MVSMRKSLFFVIVVLLTMGSFTACQGSSAAPVNEKKSIVVTYSVLGSVVKELVGDKADVTVSIPNGLDPHEWEPSAKDIEAINKADLVIQNGLDLEAALEKTLTTARERGVKFFTASDHVDIRYVGPGEGIPSGDQVIGAADPHLWMDPLEMKSIVTALAGELLNDFEIDVSSQAADLESRLDNLNQTVAGILLAVPESNRKLVTGHESMGYFARRYGFQLIGVIVPSLSSQAGVSAADLAALKAAIEENQVKAIFTEIGTSPTVAKTIGDETGAEVVELVTHMLPPDGSYFTFMTDTADVVADALKH